MHRAKLIKFQFKRSLHTPHAPHKHVADTTNTNWARAPTQPPLSLRMNIYQTMSRHRLENLHGPRVVISVCVFGRGVEFM